MNGAFHHAADAGNQVGLFRDRHDAGGGADHVDDVAFAAARADGVPMRVERADGNGNARLEAEFVGPVLGEMAADLVGSGIASAELRANAREERIDLGQEIVGRKAAERFVPHPFMAHGADAARHLCRIGDAAQHRRHQIAVFQGSRHARALLRIIAQPVQQLGEAPFGGVNAAAPVESFQIAARAGVGDCARLGLGAVVAPEVIIVERIEVGVYGNHGGTGRIERDRLNVFAAHAGRGDRLARGRNQRVNVIAMALGGVVGIVLLAKERIVGCGGALAALLDDRRWRRGRRGCRSRRLLQET